MAGYYKQGLANFFRMKNDGLRAPWVLEYIEDEEMVKNIKGRKLTNREAYRFQGVPEDYIDKLLATDIARGQHYKLAGNSICVPVLTAVFKRMFIDKTEHKPQQLSLI